MRKLMLVTVLFVASCTSSSDFEKGKAKLEQQGFTEVQYTGHDFFYCSQEDDFSTGFTCKDKNGNIVTGCFCSSILKGITIRFN